MGGLPGNHRVPARAESTEKEHSGESANQNVIGEGCLRAQEPNPAAGGSGPRLPPRLPPPPPACCLQVALGRRGEALGWRHRDVRRPERAPPPSRCCCRPPLPPTQAPGAQGPPWLQTERRQARLGTTQGCGGRGDRHSPDMAGEQAWHCAAECSARASHLTAGTTAWTLTGTLATVVH